MKLRPPFPQVRRESLVRSSLDALADKPVRLLLDDGERGHRLRIEYAGEKGQDAGGVLRDWRVAVCSSRERRETARARALARGIHSRSLSVGFARALAGSTRSPTRSRPRARATAATGRSS